MSEESQKVAFEYKLSPGYTVYSASGAQGSFNAYQQFVVNFFSERKPIPRKEVYEVSKEGGLQNPPLDIECKESIIRDVLFGISMPPHVARGLGEWLIRKVDEYDRILADHQQE